MNKRQQILIDKLNNIGYVSVIDIAKEFNVTEMTIRRDLSFFEKEGFAIRVHGGAVPRSPVPLGIDVMMQKPRDTQIAIAKQALKLLKPYQTIIFNVGTTILQIAKEIAVAKIPLTVITNSIPVAITLYKSKCQVLLTGGTLREHGLDLIGPITEKNLHEYHVDLLISGCDAALADEGFFTSDINLAEIEKKSVKISHRTIVVTESNKFGHKSFAKFANINEVDIVITDSNISKEDLFLLQKQETQVIIAQQL
ncbi:MAG: DeoR/GlpR family DNA-binding transcription regulator [Verrucomicrobiota bacterium]|nr:DeoR/GlpR family DNA-binding transcription regulator [Verrucomicrobiota bacterium]